MAEIKISATVRQAHGRPFPNFELLRRLFLIELGRLVEQRLIPELRRATRRRTGDLRRSWRVEVSRADGLPLGIVARFYWTQQRNKRQFKEITARALPRLVREAARRAARQI